MQKQQKKMWQINEWRDVRMQSEDRTNRSIRERGSVREQERSNCYDPGENRRVKERMLRRQRKEGTVTVQRKEKKKEQVNSAAKRKRRGGDGTRKGQHTFYSLHDMCEQIWDVR